MKIVVKKTKGVISETVKQSSGRNIQMKITKNYVACFGRMVIIQRTVVMVMMKER